MIFYFCLYLSQVFDGKTLRFKYVSKETFQNKLRTAKKDEIKKGSQINYKTE